MKRIGCRDNVTMSEFEQKFGTELALCVTNFTNHTVDFITAKTHPDMPVYLAMRASSAIPGVFMPVEWKGQLHLDGGFCANYPIWAYDGSNDADASNKYSGVMNNKTLGINIGSSDNGLKIYTTEERASAEGPLDTLLGSLSGLFSPRAGITRQKTNQLVVDQPRQTPGVSKHWKLVRRRSNRRRVIAAKANYPNVSEILGTNGLGKLYASSLEFIWHSQNRAQDNDRTILIENCQLSTLEFDVSRDSEEIVKHGKLGVEAASRFFTELYV